ncbi:MAG TPA: signal peptidase I [Acetomicrobium flavidum]|uniref:Signal peptidase I n=2 Tax=Acetomicrobium TaxID=49894 RepID=I4BUE7_ACEMN|nr:signal peptidase I [Acetomicrobium mobile]NLG95209.1 signal peptidase I [Acetomicrobium flavidum]AFM20904.1 signal peptidase I [Acetomicrobium mobile DSM 13181]SIN66148.1 signal peptidase I [Acetomicrobium flavidum]HOJ82543.1 signal peptidase I [Acetomicrobium flavidum]HOM31608.1 signal peptidase I [Acetomicrobium flavidum]
MKPWWKELVETLIWALVLALVLRTFVVQAFWIPSGSMIPTLMPGDRVLVAKFWYHFTEPKRGQVVVFKYPMDPTRDFVKRLIALPGETIEIKNGVVYINDSPLEEPYVKNRDFLSMEKVTVPRGQYFMMGDNRPNSQDSRFWGFVPKNYLRGPAFFRYWPLSRIGVLK